MSLRWLAREVEVCVESSLLYHCQARVLYKWKMKGLHSWMYIITGICGATEMVSRLRSFISIDT